MKFKGASDTNESELVCHMSKLFSRNGSSDFLSCRDDSGGTVIFDEINLKGGGSYLLGSITRSNQYKDSLAVHEFTCQKF